MKLLIIGSGPNWTEAPFEDPSWTVWSYGLVADLLPRVDVVFEMHRRDRWTKFSGVDSEEAYVARLNALNKPVWMQKAYGDIPLSLEYPLAEVETLVGEQFFGTFAYQLALAAFLHKSGVVSIEHIVPFGFDLGTWEEWANQRPNANRLVGFLQGMGVMTQVPRSSKLFGMPYRYGYDVLEETPSAVEALLVEGMAQLSAMMGRMADLHIAQKEALRYTAGIRNIPIQGDTP